MQTATHTPSKLPSTLDPSRLARAKTLTVEPLGHGKYRVSGGSRAHIVNLLADGKLPCACPDQIYRQQTACSHTLAALIHRLTVEKAEG